MKQQQAGTSRQIQLCRSQFKPTTAHLVSPLPGNQALQTEGAEGCCRMSAGLVESRRHARESVKTGERESARPRFHAGNCTVVQSGRPHGPNAQRRAGTKRAHGPCTSSQSAVEQACYLSSARSWHPLIPSTPLVATIAPLPLDTPHRNPADTHRTCR